MQAKEPKRYRLELSQSPRYFDGQLMREITQPATVISYIETSEFYQVKNKALAMLESAAGGDSVRINCNGWLMGTLLIEPEWQRVKYLRNRRISA